MAALWTLIIGYFMILVDSTIVSVATPQIMKALHADITGILGDQLYLLAYVVPLLAGLHGDRFSQKQAYLAGLAVFTVASLNAAWGHSASLDRGTRRPGPRGVAHNTADNGRGRQIFPTDRHGPAMAVWGTVGGVASVVGALVGGCLVARSAGRGSST